jgi:hypothetical protein
MSDTIFTTLNEYKETYDLRLENHLKEYVDYDELHFIKKELEFYISYYDCTNIKRFDIAIGSNPKQPFRDFEYRPEKQDTETSNMQLILMIFDFDKFPIKYDNLELPDFYNIEVCEKLSLSFSKIINYLHQLKNAIINQTTIDNKQVSTTTLTWEGSELEFTELIKSLILTKKISTELSQKETFNRFRDCFNMANFNENDKLRDIRNRTNTTTPFIHKLEISLNNWIKVKD